MKKDIETRADVEKLVYTFYDKVREDPNIGYFFSEVITVNWEHHLPLMVNFWENVLFQQGEYKGNPMRVHQEIHQQSPIEPKHFEHWVKLFHETINELFDGPGAELARQRGQSIATMMMLKIHS